MKDNEVAIVGGGPAGVSAAIYIKRYGMEPVLFEKDLIGGKTNYTEKIENYPGYLGMKGPILGEQLGEQLKQFDIKPIYSEVQSVFLNDDGTFTLSYGREERTFKYVILANGLSERPYHLKGEESFNRKGISRCAICDGPFYRGKDVVMIGSGNAAFEEANYLCTICRSVSLIARHEEFRAQEDVVSKFRSFPNAKIYAPYEAVSCSGNTSLESVTIRNGKTGEEKELAVQGMFVYIGAMPVTGFLQIPGVANEQGFLKADPSSMKTAIPNLYAIGDCRDTPLRQVTMAVGDGSLAATKIHYDYLKSKKSK